MNKVLFNTGGQPIYLDDLEVIQKLASESLPEILNLVVRSAIPSYVGSWTSNEILGNLIPMGTVSTSSKGFFVTPFCLSSRNDETRKVVLQFIDGGFLCIGNDFIKYEATEIEVDYGSPFYIIIKKDKHDNRTLDNGEQAPCQEHKYAIISNERSQIDECYSSDQFCSLTDAIYNIIKSKIDVNARKWTKLNVHFLSGYGGTVEYRELTDCYRFRINIVSNNNTDISGSIPLFDTYESGWPGDIQNTISCMFGAGGDDETYPSYISFDGEGNARLHCMSANPIEWRPLNCPVKTIFEIPK